MPIPMDKVYTIMHYLNEAKLDRVYPVDIRELSSFQGDTGVFKLNYHSFVGIDEVQFVLRIVSEDEPVEPVENLDVSCTFCADELGDLPLLELDSVNVDLAYGQKSMVTFTVDNNAHARDQSKDLTGVKSLKISLNKQIYRVKVHTVLFRSFDFSYTIEDILQCYEDGQNYVKDKLNDSLISRRINEIPEELERYVLMCAGAYGWLIIWENEAKPMKEPKSESNNYADRLFGRVDAGIEAYLKTALNDFDSDFINNRLVKSTKLKWGLVR